jgi:NAD(P)-dependent dehydrogenase (short-subunit alcohol dehydrogenase family)
MDFVNSFAANVVPVIRITQGAIRHFRTKKAGKIINILTSYLVGTPPAGSAEYTANKAYLEALSRSWAAENARFNITSNNIYPSFMRTGLTADVDQRLIDIMERKHPLKRLLQPEEVAEAVHFLAGASQHINGVGIVMDAGGFGE